jgi:hypothetical protein
MISGVSGLCRVLGNTKGGAFGVCVGIPELKPGVTSSIII